MCPFCSQETNAGPVWGPRGAPNARGTGDHQQQPQHRTQWRSLALRFWENTSHLRPPTTRAGHLCPCTPGGSRLLLQECRGVEKVGAALASHPSRLPSTKLSSRGGWAATEGVRTGCPGHLRARLGPGRTQLPGRHGDRGGKPLQTRSIPSVPGTGTGAHAWAAGQSILFRRSLSS